MRCESAAVPPLCTRRVSQAIDPANCDVGADPQEGIPESHEISIHRGPRGRGHGASPDPGQYFTGDWWCPGAGREGHGEVHHGPGPHRGATPPRGRRRMSFPLRPGPTGSRLPRRPSPDPGTSSDAGTVGRTTGRCLRGSCHGIAGPTGGSWQGTDFLRTWPAGRGSPGNPLRRRGQPAPRPPGGSSPRRRGHGTQHGGTRRGPLHTLLV